MNEFSAYGPEQKWHSGVFRVIDPPGFMITDVISMETVAELIAEYKRAHIPLT